MPLWGRNDQAVTANGTTTAETSSGAPIGTYTAVKAGGGANAHFGNTSAGSRAATDVAMFNNATPGAFLSGTAVGVFGVSAPEQANNVLNNSVESPAHAGWNLRRAGTGPIVSITANATLTGYNNVNIISVKSPSTDGTNATISYVTNASGGSLVFTITNPGTGFNLATIPTSNISFTNATGGTPAAGNTTVTNLVVTAGGRAGRIHYETLVAMGSLGAQTAAYGTPASANDASTDNTFFPGT
jgi:hypothetical protein